MNRAGGPFYHLRALRSASSRWRPFRDTLGEWLSEVLPRTPSLVLVGPCAAYCIADAFLARYDHVTLLEPDPIARVVLSRRLTRLGVRSVEPVARDLLVSPLVRGTPGLDVLLEERRDASVLFANVLGQIRFLTTEGDFDKWHSGWTERVAPRLARRRWASFHDRVSAAVAPTRAMPFRAAARIPDDALGATFYARAAGRVELLDHLTLGLFPAELPHAYFHWELEPGAHHLVEAVAGGA